jgi:hypothetical protein
MTQSQWQRRLAGLDDSVLQATDPTREALVALGHLHEELRQNLSADVTVWTDIIASSPAAQLHDMASLLLVAEDCSTAAPILETLQKEMKELQDNLTHEETLRKRPDGTAVNWRKKEFYLLEYTRAFDFSQEALGRADELKKRRYTPSLLALQGLLGPEWKGSVLTFTTGVCGSVDPEMWDHQLSHFGLSKSKRTATIHAAVVASLEALDMLYSARTAAQPNNNGEHGAG